MAVNIKKILVAAGLLCGSTISWAIAPQQVCLYEHPNYNGLVGCYDVGNYSDLHSWRNKISSIKVGQDVALRGYSYPNFNRKQFNTYVSLPKMGEMDDDIDSFRVEAKASQNFACIWQHPGMDGTATCAAENSQVNDLFDMKNQASAISLHGSVYLRGFSHGHLQGESIETHSAIVKMDSFDDNIDSFQVIKTEQPVVNTSRWITDLYAERPDTRIRDMVIPGTHDSATYNINSSSPYEDGAKWTVKLSKSTAVRLAKTQSQTIYDQLRNGIRHFDLRVRVKNGKLVNVHTLVGAEVEEVLDDVLAFHKKNPKEFIMLEIAKQPESEADRQRLASMIRNKLGNTLLGNNHNSQSLTLNDIWQEQKPILVLWNSSYGFWDLGSNLKGTWADAREASTVYQCIKYGCIRGSNDRRVPGLLSQDMSKFFYSAMTLTPLNNEAVGDAFNFSDWSIITTADWLKYAPGEWLAEFAHDNLKTNFVTSDFPITTSLAPAAIAQNWPVVPAPKEKLSISISQNYDWIYNDVKSGADRDVSIWRAKNQAGYYRLGDTAVLGHGKPQQGALLVRDNIPGALIKPIGFSRAWDDDGSKGRYDVNIWQPIAPKGYKCLGTVATLGYWMQPSTDTIRCVHQSYLKTGAFNHIWSDSGSGAKDDVSFWKQESEQGLLLNTFFSHRSHSSQPKDYLNYTLNPDRIHQPGPTCPVNNASFDGSNCVIFYKVAGINYWSLGNSYYYSSPGNQACPYHGASFDGSNCHVYTNIAGVKYWDYEGGRYYTPIIR